jgi:aspartate oxidase
VANLEFNQFHPIGTCTAPDEAAAQLRAIAEKRKRERT